MEDVNVLDRMLSLLMQVASSKISTTDEVSQMFTIKDKFAPTHLKMKPS